MTARRRCAVAALLGLLAAGGVPSVAGAYTPTTAPGVNSDAFLAGFGIAELTMATVFAALIGWHMLRKLLSAVL